MTWTWEASTDITIGCYVCGRLRWWQIRRHLARRRGQGCQHWGKGAPYGYRDDGTPWTKNG